ncbi:MFS transporter [Nonomuraea sp. NPDC050790]|uniref:MFS transporter n=1 Tax=Nonomuraea sp. NPDC050790 TaxID=3364371 RepID=UPI0037BE1ADC
MGNTTATEGTVRWWTLALASVAQLIVVLDSTVINIALPSIQTALHLTDAARAWAVTAYALAFGGLLLIGGRLADRFGHKQAFIAGLVGFALASGLAGLATNAGLLFAGRAAQGAFAAVLAPAALSLISTLFTDPRERNVAFGVFGALTGVGAAVGLLVGGLLTQYLSWSWCLLINVPIAAVALVKAITVIPSVARGQARPLDLPGMAFSGLGMLAVVFSFSEMATRGWNDPVLLALLALGVVLLLGFVAWEARTRYPLLPLRVVSDRFRAAAFLAIGLPQVSMFGFFLFLTYYFQLILGYSPLQTGLAFLPLSVAIGIGSTVITGMLAPRLAPRAIIVPALLLMAAGLAILIGLDVNAPAVFVTRFLPAELLIGLGLGCVIAPSISMATSGVDPDDAGVASATVNVVQQLGGSVGTALLNTVATMAAAAYVVANGAGGQVTTEAAVHGFNLALIVALAIIVATAIVVGLMLTTRRSSVAPAPQAQDEAA